MSQFILCIFLREQFQMIFPLEWNFHVFSNNSKYQCSSLLFISHKNVLVCWHSPDIIVFIFVLFTLANATSWFSNIDKSVTVERTGIVGVVSCRRKIIIIIDMMWVLYVQDTEMFTKMQYIILSAMCARIE
jgi:hypothetical protein